MSTYKEPTRYYKRWDDYLCTAFLWLLAALTICYIAAILAWMPEAQWQQARAGNNYHAASNDLAPKVEPPTIQSQVDNNRHAQSKDLNDLLMSGDGEPLVDYDYFRQHESNNPLALLLPVRDTLGPQFGGLAFVMLGIVALFFSVFNLLVAAKMHSPMSYLLFDK